MPEISVIVPAYNVADYLEETLDSLARQTFHDFEVIIVNDGSTDATQQIIDRFCARHRNFRSLSQPRSGVGAARNLALDHARGTFVCFLDGDDLYTRTALASMHRKALAEQADAVIGNYLVYDTLRTWHVWDMRVLLASPAYDPFDTRLLRSLVVWNKLYRRSVIEDNRLRFTAVRHSEDAVFWLSFAYASKRIVTVDADICLYRRRPYTGELSAMQVITLELLKDLLEAYRLVRVAALEHLEPGALVSHEAEATDASSAKTKAYLDALLRKEVFTLVNLQYRKMWIAQDEVPPLVRKRIDEIKGRLSVNAWNSLVHDFKECAIEALPVTREDLASTPLVTIAAYHPSDDPVALEQLMQSLYTQRFPRFALLLPAAAMATLPEEYANHENIVSVAGDSVTEFYNNALSACTTAHIMFTDSDIFYQAEAIRSLFMATDTKNYDFATAPLMSAPDGSSPRLLRTQRAAFEAKEPERTRELMQSMDLTLGNKLFKTSYLAATAFRFTGDLSADVMRLYRAAYFAKLDSPMITTRLDDGRFEAKTFGDAAHALADRLATSEAVSARDAVRQGHRRLLEATEGARESRSARVVVTLEALIRRLPVTRKVFVYTSRGAQLDGNALAVYEALGSRRKAFVAARTPHRALTRLRVLYHLATSKVVVLDDYDVTYLRHTSMSPHQRVIQLWHACGAFKRFGLDAGPHDYDLELSTHRQYDAVLASAENVRPSYASAFGVAVEKVRALGVPRTDFFFDQDSMAAVRRDVLKRLPQLDGKQVILYAPTFRDRARHRSVFDPRIDFADLSARLRPDQILVICRHPLITAPLLGGRTYPNIIESEEVSTNDMMLVADLLVTDYSTVIFEFLLLGKPLALYCPDLVEYDRGFYLDFPGDIPAPLLHDHRELTDFLASGEFDLDAARVESFMSSQMGACDGHSTERTIALIDEFLQDRG